MSAEPRDPPAPSTRQDDPAQATRRHARTQATRGDDAAQATRREDEAVARSPLRLAFYADDFTGATDALEVLALAGLRSALFLRVPSEATLREHGPFDAIGIAGDSRTMTPAQMSERLAPILRDLAALPVQWVHYKVCSTFDSSPQVGSIGHVIALAREAFGAATVPIVAGTPGLGRYCAFATLFARYGTAGDVHRLDRHPIMSRHPLTPMNEADLVFHLGAQAPLRLRNVALPAFAGGRDALDAEVDRAFADGAADAVVLDTVDAAQALEVGRQLERLAAGARRARFVVGSSGVESALTAWWRRAGSGDAAPRPAPAPPEGAAIDMHPPAPVADDGAVASGRANDRQAPRAAPVADDGAVGSGPANDRQASRATPAVADEFAPADRVLVVSGSASPLSAQQIDSALAAGFAEIAVAARELVAETGWQAHADALVDRVRALLAAGTSVVAHTARGPGDPRIDAMLDALVAGGLTRDDARREGGERLGRRLAGIVDRLVRTGAPSRLVVSGGDTSSRVVEALGPDALVVAARFSPGAPLCRMISHEPHLRDLQVALKGGQMGGVDFFIRARDGHAARGA